MRVLSLDQSSHCSGWAFFDNGKLVESGTFTFNDSHFPERLVKIRNKVEELIDLYCPEVVVLEDI
jgi:Holliday junction resolvasome RuvABC endonuclease subunit